jgi:hypothetical protein
MFTCRPLLSMCEKVSKKKSFRTFLLDLPKQIEGLDDPVEKYKTVAELIAEASELGNLQPVVMQPGQANNMVAYLCPTSGTSGKQVRAHVTVNDYRD